jgi:hypothetical protein
MAAIDDVELIGRFSGGTHTIIIRNKTRDKTIAAAVHIGGACDESTFSVILPPLGEARVASEGPADRSCAYEIDSAKYVARPPS